MQLTQLLAPSLSPGERQNVRQSICQSPSGSSKADDNSPSPIEWERAGVRVGKFSTCILTVKSLLFLVLLLSDSAWAWDYEGQRLVDQLALEALPAGFPAFVRTPAARERIAFLSGEPDRWRNTPDLPLKHAANPDHFFDVEDLALFRISSNAISHFRYDFVNQMTAARMEHPADFPAIEPLKDPDHTKKMMGFLPWAIAENYAKLKSGFSYLKALQEDGTPEEVRNAEENIIYVMGTMGHYAGDAAQPLHTTRNYNGWVDENPEGYTTSRAFHALIDGGYFQQAGISLEELIPKVHPARGFWAEEAKTAHRDVFPEALGFIFQQYEQVKPLYELEKSKKLIGKRVNKEGYDFLTGQLLKGSEFLANLWVSAWEEAPPDSYLKNQLLKRKGKSEPKK